MSLSQQRGLNLETSDASLGSSHEAMQRNDFSTDSDQAKERVWFGISKEESWRSWAWTRGYEEQQACFLLLPRPWKPKGLQGELTRNPAGFFVLLPSLGLFSGNIGLALKLPCLPFTSLLSKLFSGISRWHSSLKEWTNEKLGWDHKAGPWPKEDWDVGSWTPGSAAPHRPMMLNSQGPEGTAGQGNIFQEPTLTWQFLAPGWITRMALIHMRICPFVHARTWCCIFQMTLLWPISYSKNASSEPFFLNIYTSII